MDFKNRGEAEVFKHEDTRARSLTDLENGGIFILQHQQINCGFYFIHNNNEMKL